ncbi:MAG TPA: antibiotic biosynthesis monooxygenase family protein [Pyrinomonadaceae bacterium]|nr:antibiotic biosynthesis monooxygenase family protein [Pyrinomonadaceae bacterium]
MIKLIEMDDSVTLQEQMSEEIGPVILINQFKVRPEDSEQLIKAWAADAAFFKLQPGFISAQLHRGIGGSGVFVNLAVWESVADFRQAFSQPEFHKSLEAYPPGTIASPHLFQKISVPNICVA